METVAAVFGFLDARNDSLSPGNWTVFRPAVGEEVLLY